MPGFQRYPNEGFPYLVTSNVKDRLPLFAERGCCQIVIGGIGFLRTQLGHRVHAYVLMPDHMHLVVTPKDGSNVSQVMHSLKFRRVGETHLLIVMCLRGGFR